MLESDWLMNILRSAIIFRETHSKLISRHRITALYHFSKWFQLFQKALQQQYNQNQQDTGQIQKYSKRWDKNDRSFPLLATKWHFIMYVKHILYFSRSLSLADTVYTHENIRANTVNAALTNSLAP